MSFHSTSIRHLGLVIAIMAGAMTGCHDDAPPLVTADQVNSKSPDQASGTMSVLVHVPFEAPAHHILIDDVDGDGRQDLAFTSHHASYTQVFYQRSPRIFTPGPHVDKVGFHPGELLRLPTPERRLYLMNAEGDNRLRVFDSSAGSGFDVIAEVETPAPRTSSVFNWPDWGMGIATGPFATSAIYLIKTFDPLTGKHGGGVVLPFRPSVTQANSIAVADLDGDGSDELLFAHTISNVVSVIYAPKFGVAPVIDSLWSFNPGGRADAVVPADIDQDGDPDLLVPDATDKRPLDRTDINVLVNDGQGHFQLTEIPFPCRPRTKGGMPGIHAFDFAKDRDGLGYMIAAGYESLSLMQVPARWAGESPEVHNLSFRGVQAITKALLRDIDADGWLDLVMARTADKDSGIILYGPLWKNTGLLASEGIMIN